MYKVNFYDSTLEQPRIVETELPICDFLMTQFDKWPVYTNLYQGHVSKLTDVTPKTDEDCEKLNKDSIENTQEWFVVTYPQAFIPWTVILISLAISAGSSVLSYFLFRPKSVSSSENQNYASGNNRLGERENSQRINGRIPDIYGQVQSIPDLIQVPYRVYEGGKEVEYMYACVGRGAFDINPDYVRDGTAPIKLLPGAGAKIYGPGTSPLSGTPQLEVGLPFSEPLKTVRNMSGANGQTLRAPNLNYLKIKENIVVFNTSGVIQLTTSDYNFIDYFSAAVGTDPPTKITITDAGTYNGTYTIQEVSSNEIILTSAPWSANSNPMKATLTQSGDLWKGNVLIRDSTTSEVWVNVVANNGSYLIDSNNNQYKIGSTFQVSVQAIDTAGNPYGSKIFRQGTVTGSDDSKDRVGTTLKIKLPAKTACIVNVRRTSPTDLRDGFSCVDEIKLEAVYGISEVGVTGFGNVTTVQTKTYPTPQATSLKSRQLNMLVRNSVTGINGGTAITAIATDPFLGGRTAAEVDSAQIMSVMGTGGTISFYFGLDSRMSEFCYTFDDPSTSAEEMIATVAQACFCTAFRRGNKLGVSFEGVNSNSTMLYNHRNKLPGTESREYIMGMVNDHDGVELTYIEPNAPSAQGIDAPQLIRVPDDNITNPKKVQINGVRNYLQAYFHAWRIYQKMKYQKEYVEFTATAEAALNVRNDKIIVADDTNSRHLDGQIEAQSGMVITTSQPIDYLVNTSLRTIFIQHYDGTVESGSFTWDGTSRYNLTLGFTPSLPLVIDNDRFVKTLYYIPVTNYQAKTSYFLVDTIEPVDGHTWKIKATNYDEAFYAKDQDYRNGIVDIVKPPTGDPFVDSSVCTKVIVDGNRRPWIYNTSFTGENGINGSYPSGYTPASWGPAKYKILGNVGDTISITVDEPEYPSGTTLSRNAQPHSMVAVSPGERYDEFWDANGDPSNKNTQWNSRTAPKYYTNCVPDIGEAGLIATFGRTPDAPYNGSKYAGDKIVGQPFCVGMGVDVVVPADATHILFGINDINWSDNVGTFIVNVCESSDTATGGGTGTPGGGSGGSGGSGGGGLDTGGDTWVPGSPQDQNEQQNEAISNISNKLPPDGTKTGDILWWDADAGKWKTVTYPTDLAAGDYLKWDAGLKQWVNAKVVINDGVLTIKLNGVTQGTFSANQATDQAVDLVTPTPNDGVLKVYKNSTLQGQFTANQSGNTDIYIQTLEVPDNGVGGQVLTKNSDGTYSWQNSGGGGSAPPTNYPIGLTLFKLATPQSISLNRTGGTYTPSGSIPSNAKAVLMAVAQRENNTVIRFSLTSGGNPTAWLGLNEADGYTDISGLTTIVPLNDSGQAPYESVATQSTNLAAYIWGYFVQSGQNLPTGTADGQIIVWNNTTNQWEIGTSSGPPNDGVLTITSGGSSRGTFSANQAGNSVIDIPVPSAPNDGTLTLQYGGSTVGTFTANQAGNTTVNIPAAGASGTSVVLSSPYNSGDVTITKIVDTATLPAAGSMQQGYLYGVSVIA